MGHHINRIQTLNYHKVEHPLIHRENHFHFQEVDIPDYVLTNEIGLTTTNQSIHWQVSITRLLNRFPILVDQFKQVALLPDSQPNPPQKQVNPPSSNFLEFLANYPQEENLYDVPDAVWIPELSRSFIHS